MRRDARLARLAVAVPVLYFGTLFAAAATWPGYSHATQYASELGSAAAPRPAIFNGGIIAMGVVCVFAAAGLFLAALRAGGRPLWTALGAVCIGLFGISMVMGGMFPMPNPLHGGFGLGFAQVFAPLFLALALRGREGMGGLVVTLCASFVLMAATIAVMMGVGHLVTRANVGLWQRANALAMFPWMAVPGLVLARRVEDLDAR
jgi:hypothetical membrane protein